jgi:NAD(P)-dependent dehydrogenase (short-subunit alcohol dehydrogenase family)
MHIKDQVVVVTGGAHGIGRALCRRFAADGARGVVVADLDEPAARDVARDIGGLAVRTDVCVPEDLQALVGRTTEKFGAIDLFCSNAGIETGGGIDAPDGDWQRIWQINVMGHVYAARAVLPGMIARGRGYLLQTASAAGLLTQMSSAPYSATKHAAVGLADWLAITYADAGIKVSCLCPLGVRTNMLMGTDDPIAVFLREGAVDPEQVADAVVKGLATEQFLILPHPEVAEFFRRKADDYDRWLRGMQRLRASLPGMPEHKAPLQS